MLSLLQILGKSLKRYGDYMLRVLNQTDIKSFNTVKREFPYSRILMQIDSLDDGEGQLLAVSDSEDSDDDLCKKLHEYLEKDILCIIIGSYVQGGERNAIYSVR